MLTRKVTPVVLRPDLYGPFWVCVTLVFRWDHFLMNIFTTNLMIFFAALQSVAM